MIGTVKNLRPSYGFIRSDTGDDYFFMPGALIQPGPKYADLAPGQVVEFEPQEHEKGLRAIRIRVPVPVLVAASSSYGTHAH